ncbi:MAG: RHS repeat domain-containing protein, partial [Actinomycetota bacterium]
SVTNPQGLVWRYDYDPAGNLVGECDFNGRELSYVHDDAGQLVERINGAGETARFTRDLLGNVIEARCGEAVTTFVYDLAGRLVGAVNADAQLVLERDSLGRVVAETCNGATVASSYDLVGRRTRRCTPSGAESTRDYHANDRPLALHTAGAMLAFGYDAAGREVERFLGHATLAQTWDANHRLGSQAVTAGGSVAAQRSTRQARLVAHRSYSYRPDGYLSGIDSQRWIDERFYAIVTDLVGTPTELVDAGGVLAWHPRMTLWGTLVDQGSDGASCPLRFPGQYHDPETGLNYNYYRYYDPAAGRYESNDPLGLAPGPNPHAYVPNPTGWTDPLGLMSCGSSPPDRIYSARVLTRAAEESGPYHNFPGSFDDAIFNRGTRTIISDFFNKPRPLMSNDSIQYRLPSSINGRPGTFEIFTRPSVSGRNEVIQHRFFRPDR